MLSQFSFIKDLLSLLLVCSQLSLLHISAARPKPQKHQAQPALVGRQAAGDGSGLVSENMEILLGQVVKTVIYGGATVLRINSRILCPLLSHETEPENDDQPTLFIFNNHLRPEHAFRIYADDEISSEMVLEAQFDPTQMTFIFVHGWLGGIHNEIWLSEAKNAALKGSPYGKSNNNNNNQVVVNASSSQSWSGTSFGATTTTTNRTFKPNVIIVDWSEFAKGSLYSATENSFKVSRRLGRFLEQLVNVGKLRPELMHCFGHSIGTHICGQAARKAFPPQPRPAGRSDSGLAFPEKRMGRITGLDPGGFCYELGIRNETTYQGLRPSDALLVDAYYSNRSPFGNRYKVGHYNIYLNNGIHQRPCSVWLDPDLAKEYFRAAVRFSLGNVGHNDILTCDHYFATRFASQVLTPTCSFVAYACDSYRNFLRGRCGSCQSSADCYTMDFEYQRPNASISNALAHINRHSSYLNSINHDDDDDDADPDAVSVASQPLGGVPYANRVVYYMRISDDEPYCSSTFRVRVHLDLDAIDLNSFRNEWIRLRFYGPNDEQLKIMDGATDKVEETLSLHGPWPFSSRLNDDFLDSNGIDEKTLTALFEIPSTSFVGNLHKSGLLESALISNILVEYDNNLHRRQDPIANPVESIRLDYLSSTDKKIRLANSREFRRNEFRIIYKHLGGSAEFVMSKNGDDDEPK